MCHCVMSDSCPGDEQISARGKIPESRTKRLNGSLCEKRDTLLFENSTMFELQGDDGYGVSVAWTGGVTSDKTCH